jgi:deazaflavin-dependent oxidoreductase (nitroreductase family)
MHGHLGSHRLDLRNRVAGRLLRLVNPLIRSLISAGRLTGAPNVLLTMHGRRSGKIRTVPLGLLELDGRWVVQASYGETGWVANLRADGQATLTYPDGRRIPVQAVELTADEAGGILERALEANRRSRFLRFVLGPRFRPPIGVLTSLGLRVDDTPEEYVADARRHPLFELRPITEAPGRASPPGLHHIANVERDRTRATSNRLLLRIAGRSLRAYSIVKHYGRRSGREYVNPVSAYPLGDGFVIAILYGLDSQWVRNVVTTGRVKLVTRGREHLLERPQVVPPEQALSAYPWWQRLLLRSRGIEHFLWAHEVGAA